MSGNTKKFLADNFANIAIALSVVFLVFELTQNRDAGKRTNLHGSARIKVVRKWRWN